LIDRIRRLLGLRRDRVVWRRNGDGTLIGVLVRG
jgi:hypothetical protein